MARQTPVRSALPPHLGIASGSGSTRSTTRAPNARSPLDTAFNLMDHDTINGLTRRVAQLEEANSRLAMQVRQQDDQNREMRNTIASIEQHLMLDQQPRDVVMRASPTPSSTCQDGGGSRPITMADFKRLEHLVGKTRHEHKGLLDKFRRFARDTSRRLAARPRSSVDNEDDAAWQRTPTGLVSAASPTRDMSREASADSDAPLASLSRAPDRSSTAEGMLIDLTHSVDSNAQRITTADDGHPSTRERLTSDTTSEQDDATKPRCTDENCGWSNVKRQACVSAARNARR